MTEVSHGYQCRTCGACCAAFEVRLDAYETQRFTRDRKLRRLTILDERPRLHVLDGACIAHLGTVGESSSCAIYGKRPIACKTVQPGDGQCLTARNRYGLST